MDRTTLESFRHWRGTTAGEPKRLGIMISLSGADSSEVSRPASCGLSKRSSPAHGQIGHGREAVFNLNCWTGSVELRENYGFAAREIAGAASVLAEHLPELCCAWEEIHGWS